MGFLPKMFIFNILHHIKCKYNYFGHEFHGFVFFCLYAQKYGNYPHVCIKNQFIGFMKESLALKIKD